MIELFDKNELKDRIDMYLIGGYCDEDKKSIKVSKEILSNLIKQQLCNIEIKLFFSSLLNNKTIEIQQSNKKKRKYACPRIQNVGYNFKTKQFFPITMESSDHSFVNV